MGTGLACLRMCRKTKYNINTMIEWHETNKPHKEMFHE